VLFDNNGVLFMKDWGSRESVKQLIKNKDAYCKIHKSWALVRRLGKNYKKTRVLAEFLYTGINRRDLPSFWKRCLRSGIIPFVEVPIIKGRCADNFRKLKIDRRLYVKDIYELSLLNLSILCGMTKREAKRSDLWQPPYGSVFPSPCNKLTRAKGLFLERDGNLSVCCGISAHLGNISDKGIDKKLKNSFLLKGIRSAYNNLKGFCGACDYSRDMHICYGCRGNAYTYTGNNEGVFGEDPMCFGRLAIALDKKGELNKIMSLKHVDILRKYFGEKRDAGDH
jgi:MoaA/NifB/PqqE/SkfB family radical SAM enzyme